MAKRTITCLEANLTKVKYEGDHSVATITLAQQLCKDIKEAMQDFRKCHLAVMDQAPLVEWKARYRHIP